MLSSWPSTSISTARDRGLAGQDVVTAGAVQVRRHLPRATSPGVEEVVRETLEASVEIWLCRRVMYYNMWHGEDAGP